ncbi:hypothetical protein [Microvirga rosea]|uniref:hypothetical protein n=1 Tax=Microvirga rosea TaxID=2715425 RepID=UPI001D0AB995|nr:hypothetical protein [Microvirga rosea]MCB8822903.1 hypothetical protein [Microvirga rosea]
MIENYRCQLTISYNNNKTFREEQEMDRLTHSNRAGPVSTNRAVAKYQLAEVWGDVVDLRQLGVAIIIGAAISLGTYFIAGRIFAATVEVAAVGRAYAMLAGLVGCVVSGIVCAKLFPPKREVMESAADPSWRAEAMEQLAAETGTIGRIEDLPPVVAQEMKELGLYDLFASYDSNRNADEKEQGTVAPQTLKTAAGA